MPGTVRTFTYSLIPAPEDVALVAAHTRKVVGWACDGDKALTCHGVSGEELGLVTFTVTVRGRDRWWAAQQVQDILNLVCRGLGDKAGRLVAGSEPLPPHTNRGHTYTRSRASRQASFPTTPTTVPGDEPLSADVSSPGSVT